MRVSAASGAAVLTLLVLTLALTPTGTASAAELKHVNGEEWMACFTKEDYQELVKVALSEDEQAFQDMVTSDRCFPLKDGVAVWVEETSEPGIVAIRAEGSSLRVWTTGEAVAEPQQEAPQ